MNAAPDRVRIVYRWFVVACATLVALLLISLFFPSVALALEGPPHALTGYSGCGLLVASFFYLRVRDPLFLIGLAIGAAAILVSWIPALVRA
jgi:hypothetical protein